MRSTHVPEQLVWPLGHWQAPPKHCSPPEHWVPQVPQLAGSVLVSVQPMPHAVRPVEQLAVHAPDEQTWLDPQAVPHDPQLSGSFDVSVQEPEQATIPGPQGAPPPVPLVEVPPVPLVEAPPVPLDVAAPAPVVDLPPVPVVDLPPVPVVEVEVDPVMVAVVAPPALLPQPAANPAAPATSAAARNLDARDR